MDNLIISTEVICDLPKETLQKYDIKVAPVDYFVDGKEYNTETNHMSECDFYNSMRSGADVKTTQVNQENAKVFLEKLFITGKNILHLTFSSGLSGTANNFKLASEELNGKYQNKCVVVDSLCAAAGQGLFVMLVAKKAQEENMSFDKLIQYAEDLKLRINHLFTVDDLRYLVKGGRVSKGSARIANILHIKPLMHVDNEGKLEVIQKVFSRGLTIKKMFEKMMLNYNPYFADILICEADCKEDANFLAKLIKDYYGLTPTIVPLNYFIGGHSGPGTLALFYVGDKRI